MKTTTIKKMITDDSKKKKKRKQRIRLLSIVECGTHLFIIPQRTTGDDDNDEEGHVEPMVI